jgi:carbon starvation protein CstA
MISFIIAVVLLILGYLLYSKVVERVIGVDPQRTTPAVAHPDGVDYVPMKPWRIFLIQFLNIAGVGPICGAIMGAQFGTASFLWIVFGCIFAGAVHDFIAGFVSIRQDGASLPEIHGKYLGNGMKQFMRGFTVLLMILVGAVFVNTPAVLLNQNFTPDWNIFIWVGIIFAYYLLATLLPIDKVIGKIYPIFGILLLAMAVAIVVAFVVYRVPVPEVWQGMENRHPQAATNPIFPMMFISIACGAISGFHATQSPLMARCMKDERLGRRVFYGSMITEGLVALIWASISSYFFYAGGWKDLVSPDEMNAFVAQFAGPDGKSLIQYFSAPTVVKIVCTGWLGIAGGILAMLGVVAAPITSGDTALRSGRLIIAEALGLEQKSIKRRLYIAVPMFVATFLLLMWQLKFPDGFNMLWQYFGWSNQTLSVFTLWTLTVYLALKKKPYIITLIPAIFMTAVCTVFLIVSPQALNLGDAWALPTAVVVAIVAIVWFFVWRRRHA